jgi:hypothetical protein
MPAGPAEGSTVLLDFAGLTIDLTPGAGLPMGGYLLRAAAVASGAHDPLEGSLFWLSHESGGEVCWVSIDALSVDVELARAIASGVAAGLGGDPGSVLVCASHTHSSAAGWLKSVHPSWEETADLALRTGLVDRLTAAARGLPGKRRRVRLLAAEGLAPDVGGNRNVKDGVHDDSAGVLAVIDEQGEVMGVLIDYASHPTVLGHDNLLWSADYPGAARRAMAARLRALRPDGFAGESQAQVVAFLQGAAGDASPRFTRRAQTFGEADRIGGLLAAAGLRALRQGTPIDPPGIRVLRDGVRIQTRSLPSLSQARDRILKTEGEWKEVRDREGPGALERIARTRHEGALVMAQMAEVGLPAFVEMPLSVVAVGSSAWVHLPVEPFASLGLNIRSRSPFQWTRVIGYTDGYFGYVADAPAFEAEVYEAASSLFDARAAQTLCDAAVALLGRAAEVRPAKLSR